MKHIILACAAFLLLASSITFGQQQTEINRDQHEDIDHDGEREEWIRSLHRAAPATAWQQMDEATRQSKYQAYLSTRHKPSGETIQSLPQDTIAGGSLLGYWGERGSGNVCGRMHTADIDFTTNTIYAASCMGNIWKASLANTNQWTSLNDQRRFGEVRMLRIVTTPKGKRIIAMANEPAMVYFPNVPAMVYFSDDDGGTWQSATGLTNPSSNGGFKRGVVSADELTMYVMGNEWNATTSSYQSALYRSTNQGKNFVTIEKWATDVNKCDIWMSRDVATLLYVLRADSLFEYNGTSMIFVQKMSYAHSIASIGSLLLQGTVKNNVVNLSVLETTNGAGSIRASSDAGVTWSQTGSFSGTPFNTNSFKMLGSDPKTLAIGATNAFYSKNGGGAWNLINDWSAYYGDETINLHADIDGIDFITSPAGKETELFFTDGGIFMSVDGMASFKNITLSGIATSQYYSVVSSSISPNFIFGGAQDQGYQRVQDDGSAALRMTQIISGDYGHLSSSDLGGSLWMTYPGFALYYPDAQGSNSNVQWNFTGTNHVWMAPVVADPLDAQSSYIASGGSGSESFIYHLTSNGSSISETQLSFDFSGGNSQRHVSAIAFSPIVTSQMYVLTNDGEFFASTNTGNSWNMSLVTGPGDQYFYGNDILPSQINKNLLWIAGSGYSNPGVYQSTDNGVTFTAINSGLPSTLITSLAATDDEKFLFAATDVGPYVYNVATGKWYEMSKGHAPDMVYWSVEYIASLKTVRFGTYGRGIWDFTLGVAPQPRSYTILTPKTGDTLISGTQNYAINYIGVNEGSQKTFSYSSDGGLTWTAITGSLSGSTFSWTQVPVTPTTKGVIRMTDEFGTVGLSGLFVIKKGSITIISPKAGEVIVGGTADYVIKYTASIPGIKKKFEFTSDGGNTWSTIVASDSTSTTYTWASVPNISTTKGIIRLSDELGTFGVSGTFSINKKVGPSIFKVAVSGVVGSHIVTGTATSITWSSSGNLGSALAAEYSADNSQWTLISNTIPVTSTSLPWTTPAPSTSMFVRVRSVDDITISGTYGPFAIDANTGVNDLGIQLKLHITNHPNPVSQKTTFEYTLPERGIVNLIIYDQLGREVGRVISSELKDQGSYTIDFDAARISAGSYTYALDAAGKQIIGKMTVIR